MKGINIKNITKSYDGKQNVIENFNLEIVDGEFVVLLGPSGCGKSTLLRIIAGLEETGSGQIFIDDECISEKEPKDRNIAMVFQNYALYPHMTVYKNIGIGLMLKKVSKDIVDKKVNEVARILGIVELLDRKPRQLSGGQMQRVALARAMIRDPKVFLMDEPLSNLDSKLRVQTRSEILKLYKKLKVTTVYVTHDQVEAMTMATTIVLMKDGKIMQKGSPNQLYIKPQNKFVAEFIGAPQMNFIEGKIEENYLTVGSEKYKVAVEDGCVVVGIRPEHIEIREKRSEEKENFVVELIENLGSEKLVYLKSIYNENQDITVRTDVATDYKIGEVCSIELKEEYLHIFDKESEKRVN